MHRFLPLSATLSLTLLLGALLGAPAAGTQDLSGEVYDVLEWREVGPYRGGRSAAVAGLPGDRETYYFGAAGGGVWKTEDGGRSWTNVSDGYFGGSIGAVAVSEWDPNVVYVGGGEKTVRGNVSHGDGVWKSTDAGRTWRHVGLGDSRHVARLRIHPRDPELVYAAVMGHLFGPGEERGVYRSRDGGATWERVLFAGPDAGAVDLVLDPTNPRILYASTWRIRRTPYSLESGGEGSALWKSTDGGDTWTDLSENDGMPGAPLGIIGVSVSPADPDLVYAIVEAEEGGLLRSHDAGETWKRVNESRDLRQRAWYYSRVVADPKDVDMVYVLNVGFHRSKDGGKSFERISVPHGDNHDLWIDPADPLRMVQSNDGGANVSTDRGRTWTDQAGQPTSQMYRVSVDDDFPYRLLGGQQDNSAVRIRSRSFAGSSIGERDWEPTAGGESGHIVAKPGQPHIVYGGSYGGTLVRVNHDTGERRSINVWPDNPMGWGAAELKYRFNWNFPLLVSPHDPDLLYAAGNVLFASRDEGATWKALSGDLTRNDKSKQGSSGGPITQDNTSVEYYGTIFAVAESPLAAGTLWTGSDDGLVHVSRDGGESWYDVTPPDCPETAQINSIEASPFEAGGLYVAATCYKSDDFQPYLYRTSDHGKTWTTIVDGIETDHFTRVVRADPGRAGLLYAGTERGVYVSFDDGARWQSLQLDLPVVPVTDLVVAAGDLVVATQGRGYWILDDLSVFHQLQADHRESSMHLYRPRPAVRLIAGAGRREDPSRAGTNPESGVSFHYWLAEEPAEEVEVTLELFEADGDLVRRFTREAGEDAESWPGWRGSDPRILTAEAGLNRFVWDLDYPEASSFEGMVLWNSSLDGPRALPGNYRALLTVGEGSTEVSFEVQPDPRSGASESDRLAQFEFVKGLRDTLDRTHRDIRRLREVRTRVQGVKKDLDPEQHASLVEQADQLLEGLKAVEETLYQTRSQSRQDPLNFPIRLNDKLAGVLGQSRRGDAAPTAAARSVAGELGAAIESELQALGELLEGDLESLEQDLQEAGVPRVRWTEKADSDTTRVQE